MSVCVSLGVSQKGQVKMEAEPAVVVVPTHINQSSFPVFTCTKEALLLLRKRERERYEDTAAATAINCCGWPVLLLKPL